MVDTEFENAYRHFDFNDVANLFVEKSFTNGGLDGDFSFAQVGFMWVDDGENHLAVVRQVGHFDLGQQTDTVVAQQGFVEYSCMFQHPLLETDTT